MSWGTEWLGLQQDADERAIKRAYAQRLRQSRPDEDAHAFQQLHDAYQDALAAHRTRVGYAATALSDASAAPRQPASSEQSVQPRGADAAALSPQPDPLAALDSVLREGDQAQDADFARWLQQQSQDWSLDTRAAMSAALLDLLRRDAVAMRDSNLFELFALFGWDEVAAGVDVHELNWLAQRANAIWLQDPSQHFTLSLLLNSNPESRPGVAQIADMLDQLQQPRSYFRNLLASFRSTRTHYILRILELLGCQPGLSPPKGINASQMHFWMSVEGDATHRFRLQSRLLRSLLFSAVLSIAWMVMLWIVWSGETPSRSDLQSVAFGFLGALLAPPLVTLINFTQLCLYEYQGADENEPTRYPWLRILFIPLVLAFCAMAWPWLTAHGAAFIMVGWPLSWKLLRLAQVRFWHRRGKSLDISGFRLFWMLAGCALVAPALAWALLYWILDLFHQGRRLRWSNG